ncbi:transposase family protein [Leptospira interrogans]|nr:hypothetical protein C5473_07170 [Leptospira interrogans serovar Weerasinghe]QCO38124.1 hypothetical protein E4412_13690 [Leptospira interrogans]
MITSAIPKDVACVLDSGFEGIEKTSKKTNIIKPKKKPKKRELTAKQKAKNRRISKKRIFVENAFAGIKRFRITSDVIRSFRKNFKHLVFVLAAGLWNFHLFLINGLIGNFSTTLIYNFLELNTYVFVKIDKSIFGIIFICTKFFE